jgi:putative redox protein
LLPKEGFVEKEDAETPDLKESLSGYKEKVTPVTKGTLTWERDLLFMGRTQSGYEIEFDAHVQWGCAPTESLLLSLSGCMGIDMVSFLQKMKASITSFKIEILGDRNPKPPQYFKAIEMIVHISGENVTPRQIERAVSLSQEKYCSVYHSLRKDLKVSVRYVLNGQG